MSIASINLETEEQMTEFIKFLSNKSIRFTADEYFIKLLYKSIISGKINPSWLDNDIFDKYLDDISKEYNTDERVQLFINSVKGHYNESFSSVKLKPTEHFKKFCGPEWLNHEGRMSKKSAYNFVMYQISVRDVVLKDEKIYLNDYLKDLLNVNVYVLSKWELVSVIDSLFICEL